MTDERDPKVTQRYRELGADEPPPALDAAILAAARRVDDKPHAPLVTPAGRHRWYFGLAAAAVLVLAVSVTLHVERQQPDEAVVASTPLPKQEPAPTAKKALPPKPQTRFTPDPPPPAAAPAPAPQPEPARAPELASRSAADAMIESRPRAEVGAAAPAPAQSAPAPMRREAQSSRSHPEVAAERALKLPPQPIYRSAPEVWLKEIARLRGEGRHEEADRELEEFRKRNPDYKISGPMLDRVERR